MLLFEKSLLRVTLISLPKQASCASNSLKETSICLWESHRIADLLVRWHYSWQIRYSCGYNSLFES